MAWRLLYRSENRAAARGVERDSKLDTHRADDKYNTEIFGVVLEILNLQGCQSNVEVLRRSFNLVGGLAYFGILHPRAIRALGPFTDRVSRRIHQLGRLSLLLEGSSHLRRWSSISKGLAQVSRPFHHAIIAFSATPSEPAYVLSTRKKIAHSLPIGSAVVQLLADGMKARVLCVKCPRHDLGIHIDYALELYQVATLVGVPVTCTVVITGADVWLASARFENSQFNQFLKTWCALDVQD